MSYLTFRELQRRAKSASLVMFREGVYIHLRYRDPQSSDQTWSGLDAKQAADVVAAVVRMCNVRCDTDKPHHSRPPALANDGLARETPTRS